MVSKEEMQRLRERASRHYANQPDAIFKKPKEMSIGGALISKANKYKGFKIN